MTFIHIMEERDRLRVRDSLARLVGVHSQIECEKAKSRTRQRHAERTDRHRHMRACRRHRQPDGAMIVVAAEGARCSAAGCDHCNPPRVVEKVTYVESPYDAQHRGELGQLHMENKALESQVSEHHPPSFPYQCLPVSSTVLALIIPYQCTPPPSSGLSIWGWARGFFFLSVPLLRSPFFDLFACLSTQ